MCSAGHEVFLARRTRAGGSFDVDVTVCGASQNAWLVVNCKPQTTIVGVRSVRLNMSADAANSIICRNCCCSASSDRALTCPHCKEVTLVRENCGFKPMRRCVRIFSEYEFGG